MNHVKPVPLYVSASIGREAVGEAAIDDSAPVSRLKAWTTVFILFSLSTVAWIDRSVVTMMVGPLKQHFGIGDFQVSLLLGPAFAIFYILTLIPIGIAADRYSRRAILFGGVVVWSIASAFCGIAGTYTQLFLARMFVGAGEGAVQPIAGPIIRHLFGRARMAGAISLYSLGTSAGSAIGVIGGGFILAWAAAHGPIILPGVGAIAPWQLVFLTFGLPGIALAFLAFGIVDARPAATPAGEAGPALIPYLRAHPVFWLTALGFVVSNVAVTGVVSWTPAYLSRQFGFTPPQAGIVTGTVAVASPFVFQAAIGFVVNRMMAHGIVDAPLRVMRWALVAAVPIAVALWLAPTAPIFIGAFFALMALLFVGNPMGMTAIQLLAPAGLNSRLSAVYFTLFGLIGLGAGPSVVGFLSQYVMGEDHLSAAMALTAGGAVTIAALFLSFALRPLRAVAQAAPTGDSALAVPR